MKATSLFAIAALALAGTACSEAAENAETVEATSAEVIEIAAEPQEAEVEGTFNLNLGLEDDEPTGGLNLNLGGDDSDTGLIGAGELSTGSAFGDDDDLFLNLPTEDLSLSTEIDAKVEAEDDGLIRLED